MYKKPQLSPQQMLNQNKFIGIAMKGLILFVILYLLTFRLPIIPNEWLVKGSGTITFIILSCTLFYFLFTNRDTNGKLVFTEMLNYKYSNLAQKILACLGVTSFCSVFYFFGQLLTPIIVAPIIFLSNEANVERATLTSISIGQRWYHGYTKLTFQYINGGAVINFYWPTDHFNNVPRGTIVEITKNKTPLGSHIIDITK